MKYLRCRLIQWNSVNKSTVNKSSRLLHPIRLERNRPNPLLKPPRIKSKTGCPEVDLLTEFHCNSKAYITFDRGIRSSFET